jgi:hypothetical protein
MLIGGGGEGVVKWRDMDIFDIINYGFSKLNKLMVILKYSSM